MTYVYPAVFTEEDGGYAVTFPDLEGCYTCGDDLDEAIKMGEDVLALTLVEYEDKNKAIPLASPHNAIPLDGNDFISYIRCDTVQYRKILNNPFYTYNDEVEGHTFWVAKSLSLKGCVGQGDTLDAAVAELAVNENDWLEEAKEFGIPIP